jgi:hypothetical protein
MLDSGVNVPLGDCGAEDLVLRGTWVDLWHVLSEVPFLVLGIHVCGHMVLLLRAQK